MIKPKTHIILGGGCFWCVEAIFQRIKGVLSVESGYAGGSVQNPSYEMVCAGDTGHAEVCRIGYDEKIITFKQLLDVFWICHDPTTLNRQGNDVGSQYRSLILCASTQDLAICETSKKQAQKQFDSPIVTEIVLLDVFYPAELDHHQYFNQHNSAPYCQVVIVPKLKKLGLLDSRSV